jgi:hypothetical protein
LVHALEREREQFGIFFHLICNHTKTAHAHEKREDL